MVQNNSLTEAFNYLTTSHNAFTAEAQELLKIQKRRIELTKKQEDTSDNVKKEEIKREIEKLDKNLNERQLKLKNNLSLYKKELSSSADVSKNDVIRVILTFFHLFFAMFLYLGYYDYQLIQMCHRLNMDDNTIIMLLLTSRNEQLEEIFKAYRFNVMIEREIRTLKRLSAIEKIYNNF
jgi:hypothetical protein